MDEPKQPDGNLTAPEASKDSFGLWLEPGERAERPPAGSSPKSSELLSAEIAAMRAFRAGKGPLASVVSTLSAPGAPVDGPELNAKLRRGRAVFVPLEKPALLCLVVLATLIVIGGYAVQNDLRRLESLW